MPRIRESAAAAVPPAATVHGSPGVHPRQRGWLMLFAPLAGGAFAMGWCLRAAVPVPDLAPRWAGFLLAALAASMAAYLLHVRRRQSDFDRGARGEEETARILAALPRGWHVFHGLVGLGEPLGDVDHAVVSPHGIYVIDTLNWSGRASIDGPRLLYNGCRPDRDPVEAIQRVARAVRGVLGRAGVDQPVHPVLCLPHAALTRDAEGLSGVIICRQSALPDVLRDGTEAPIDEPAIRRIAEILHPLTEAEP